MVDATLIVGSASSLGQEVVSQLIEQGQTVISMDSADPPNGISAAHFQKVRLEDPGDVSAALTRLIQGHRVTRLVNNIQPFADVGIDNLTARELQRSSVLDLHIPLLCLKAVVPHMRDAAFGRIVTVTGWTTMVGRGIANENATMTALHSATRTWALELASQGITANAIVAGAIDTSEFDALLTRGDANAESIAGTIPLRRFGTPQELVEAVKFFLSERASYITGQVLHVCGGASVGRFTAG